MPTMIGTYRGECIGWGPWRANWYSICSQHFKTDPACRACMAGHYINDWRHAMGKAVHDRCYPLWYWWANRPNSRSRRFLEEVFPGLKGDKPTD
jgi:hypothetical protein